MQTSPRYCPFVREIRRSLADFRHKVQRRGDFDVFFDLRLNRRLSKQSRFGTPTLSLWLHCNTIVFRAHLTHFILLWLNTALISGASLHLSMTYKLKIVVRAMHKSMEMSVPFNVSRLHQTCYWCDDVIKNGRRNLVRFCDDFKIHSRHVLPII